MDGWDTKPTPQERARITADFVAEQLAWEQRLASLPAAQRARAASDDADAAEARLAAEKRRLIRAEAMRLHVSRLNAEKEQAIRRAEGRVAARLTPLLSGDEIAAIRSEEAARAEGELRAWAAANPPPTLADDEQAIRELLRETDDGR
jgi:hypothetical protein